MNGRAAGGGFSEEVISLTRRPSGEEGAGAVPSPGPRRLPGRGSRAEARAARGGAGEAGVRAVAGGALAGTGAAAGGCRP